MHKYLHRKFFPKKTTRSTQSARSVLLWSTFPFHIYLNKIWDKWNTSVACVAYLGHLVCFWCFGELAWHGNFHLTRNQLKHIFFSFSLSAHCLLREAFFSASLPCNSHTQTDFLFRHSVLYISIYEIMSNISVQSLNWIPHISLQFSTLKFKTFFSHNISSFFLIYFTFFYL